MSEVLDFYPHDKDYKGKIFIQTSNGDVVAILVGKIIGTSNQITVTNNGTIIQISTPQDIAPTSSPTFDSLYLTKISDQLILGSTRFITINAPTPSSSRIYTIPDVLEDALFVMTKGDQTIDGVKTFSDIIVTGTSIFNTVVISGTVNLSNLIVSGNSTFNNVTITGAITLNNLTLTGTLTGTTAIFTGLTVNGPVVINSTLQALTSTFSNINFAGNLLGGPFSFVSVNNLNATSSNITSLSGVDLSFDTFRLLNQSGMMISCNSGADLTSVPNDTWTDQPFSDVQYSEGLLTYSAPYIVIPFGDAGMYSIVATVHFTANVTGNRGIALVDSFGNFRKRATTNSFGAGDVTAITVVDKIYLPSGNLSLKCQVYQNSGGALSITNPGFFELCTFKVIKLY